MQPNSIKGAFFTPKLTLSEAYHNPRGFRTGGRMAKTAAYSGYPLSLDDVHTAARNSHPRSFTLIDAPVQTRMVGDAGERIITIGNIMPTPRIAWYASTAFPSGERKRRLNIEP